MVTGAPEEKQGRCQARPEASPASLALILLEKALRPGVGLSRERDSLCALARTVGP